MGNMSPDHDETDTTDEEYEAMMDEGIPVDLAVVPQVRSVRWTGEGFVEQVVSNFGGNAAAFPVFATDRQVLSIGPEASGDSGLVKTS